MGSSPPPPPNWNPTYAPGGLYRTYKKKFKKKCSIRTKTFQRNFSRRTWKCKVWPSWVRALQNACSISFQIRICMIFFFVWSYLGILSSSFYDSWLVYPLMDDVGGGDTEEQLRFVQQFLCLKNFKINKLGNITNLSCSARSWPIMA